VTVLPPIQFDVATGVLEGASAWERVAALALSSGSKVASTFSHRGYNSSPTCCADVAEARYPTKLNADATFEFRMRRLLEQAAQSIIFVRNELELLFGIHRRPTTRSSIAAPTLATGLLISSAPMVRQAIAIEPSSQNSPSWRTTPKSTAAD